MQHCLLGTTYTYGNNAKLCGYKNIILGYLLWNLQSCVKLNSYEKDTACFVSYPEWHYTTE